MSKKNFIETFFESYPTARQIIVIILVIALSFTGLIRDETSKMSLLASLGVTLLFVIYDFYKTIKSRLDTIDSNITQIDNKIKRQAPPTYAFFTKALPDIKDILSDRLKKNGEVRIRILAVSAKFSWKNIVEDMVMEILSSFKPKPTITVELLLTQPSLLHNWGQNLLEVLTNNTLECIKIFKKTHKNELSDNGSLKLSYWIYDNIPHWHGIQIDDDVLFMGRCYWEEIDNRLLLKVGEKEYRQFTLNDDFQGQDRIKLFDNWFNLYKKRAIIIFPNQ